MDKIKEKYNIMLGSDPEIIATKRSNGITKQFPVTGLIGGDKLNPFLVDESGFRTLQEDNVAIEYTTHPTSNLEDFVREQEQMRNVAFEKLRENQLSYSTQAAAVYENIFMRHSAVQKFGCEPTWNAWKNEQNPTPTSTDALRSVGGHIHVSYDNNNDEMSVELVRLCDLIYISMVNFNKKLDFSDRNEISRRNLYGKSGEMRIKSYGFEWRTPSNHWIFEIPKIEMMYRIVMEAFKHYDKGYRVKESSYEIIQNAINRGDKRVKIKLRGHIKKI